MSLIHISPTKIWGLLLINDESSLSHAMGWQTGSMLLDAQLTQVYVIDEIKTAARAAETFG